jgi:hypothetical protein
MVKIDVRSLKKLLGLSCLARDGKAGETKGLYFNDQSWVIRQEDRLYEELYFLSI